MQRRSIVVPVLAMASLVVATSAGGVPAKDSFALKGEVYATGFKIEMENAAGRKLRSIRAGTYRIKIEDKATIHNFRLRGPGINRATSVPRRSEQIWTVKLQKGTYRFLCDPHAATMSASAGSGTRAMSSVTSASIISAPPRRARAARW